MELTNDGATPNANGEWLWTESTQTLQIYSTSAPSSSVIFVVSYYIFATNEKLRILPEDPTTSESSSNPLRAWEPRLLDSPRLKQSVKNVLDGVFSIESTTISLQNQDGELQQYLSLKDSLSDAEVDVWVCLDSANNIQRAYQGKCKSVGGDIDVVDFEVHDSFTRLNQKCLMGDTADECYFTSSGFSSVDPKNLDRPVPYIVGPYSRFTVSHEAVEFKSVLAENLYEAVCTSYDGEESTSLNRTWGLCRVSSDGLRVPTIGAINSISGSEDVDLGFTVGEWANVEIAIGQFIKFEESGDTAYGEVYEINTSTRTISLLVTGTTRSWTTSVTLTPSAAPTIKVTTSDSEFVLTWGFEYTFSETTTTGGNKYVSITFLNNFEALNGNLSVLHPRTHQIFFRVAPSVVSANHADVVQSICESSGLTVDSTSFAASKAELSALGYFSMPQFDESDFGTYRDYLQLLLKSTLGIVYLNNDFQVAYDLLAAPSSSDITTANDHLIGPNFSVEYQDIVTQLIAYNPHNSDQPNVGYTESSGSTVESFKARYLHAVQNVDRFRHVLNDISGRLQAILDVRSSRRATYRFKTATKHLDAEIGDDMQLESSVLLGGDSSTDLKIVSLDKSLDDVEVEATDLQEL